METWLRLASISNYVTSDDREALKMSLSDNSDSQDPDPMDFLSSYKCFRLPTCKTIRTIIVELAHQELIQRPRYVAEYWAPVVATNLDLIIIIYMIKCPAHLFNSVVVSRKNASFGQHMVMKAPLNSIHF